MFLNKYKINPCKACKMFYPINDINNINYCCYDVLGAFTGKSLNEIRNLPEAQNCKDCVDESIKALGRDKCNFRITPYTYWNQVPHYFPSLLNQENDKNKAYKLCIEQCGNSRYKEECKQNCLLDLNAIDDDNVMNDIKRALPDNSPVNHSKNNLIIVSIIAFTILIIFIVIQKKHTKII
jgi:hypothetical protein